MRGHLDAHHNDRKAVQQVYRDSQVELCRKNLTAAQRPTGEGQTGAGAGNKKPGYQQQ